MNISFLTKTVLFRGIEADELETLLDCLKAERKVYGKGETVYHAGDSVQALGMVLAGSVRIESDDVWGNKSILDQIGPGQVFAETYACIPSEPLMVSVIAAGDAEILFLNTGRMLHTCSGACPFHSKLIRNLLAVSSQKNLNLSRRIFHTSSKSIRGRLLSYLSFQAARQGSFEFSIPFNRQQLADYLSVDRSALSNELSRMQKDGLLTVEKNHFVLEQVNEDWKA